MKFKTLQNIVLLPGDGIGPEVVAQAEKVITALAHKYGHQWRIEKAHIGACAIDLEGDPFPASTQQLCQKSDAILLGAIGHPKYDNDPTAKIRPEQGLLRMRKELGLYANIRPVKTHSHLHHLSVFKPEHLMDVDFVILRELTGGIYFGEKIKTNEWSSDLCKYHQYEIERITHHAFEYAGRRRKKLTLVDKANVLETSRLWRKIVQNIAQNYPNIEVEYIYVDNAAMQIILNPQSFDVILCDNLFGDILSDEASVLAGSLGMLPSSSIGENLSLYEPIHGSYPQAAGKDIANPLATILSVEMMMKDFGLLQEANDIINAVNYCIENGFVTEDLKPSSPIKCSILGSKIANLIAQP